MDIIKCEKCNDDLPFSATKSLIKCAFCGMEHKIKNAQYKHKQSNKLESSSDVAEGIVDSLIDAFFD